MSDQTKYSSDMTSHPAEREIRTAVLKLEKRDSAPSVLVGYASTFNQPYSVERVLETIDRRAFDRTLVEQPDVFALIGHDQSRVIARTKNGTLSLLPDETGLRVEISQGSRWICRKRNQRNFVQVDIHDLAMHYPFAVLKLLIDHAEAKRH